jgi:hypothetical protein
MDNAVSVAHLEQAVITENSVAKPKRWIKRVLKVLLVVSLSLVTLTFVVQLIWRFSGSNQWELVRDQNGVKIYTLKTPGLDSIQVKGMVRLRSTLSGMLTFMLDPGTCADYGCYDSYVIERVDDQILYSTFRTNLPFPFQTRQYVIRSQLHQDPQTKEVLLVNSAVPDKIPLNDCCFRVTAMNNTLRFKPLGNGEVDLEFIMNMNEGGYVPSLILSRMYPKVVYSVLRGMQRLLDREKYQNAKHNYIQEK